MTYKAIYLIFLIILGSYCVDPVPLGCDTNNNAANKKNQLGLNAQSDEDSTWTLLGSSVYQTWDTPPVFYSHITLTKENKIKIRTTDKSFVNSQQTLQSATKIQIVGSIEHVVLVKQYDTSDVFTNYATYHFDFAAVDGTPLVRTAIPVKYNTWTYKMILQLDDQANILYWIMTDSGKTYLVQIDMGVGTDGNDFNIDNSILDIKVGSSQSMFDETSKQLFTYDFDEDAYLNLVIGTDVGVNALLQSIRYHKTYSHGFAIQSRMNDQSQFNLIVIWYKFDQDLVLEADIAWTGLSGDPTKLYTENQYNFVISRTDNGIWINVDFEGTTNQCVFAECMDETTTGQALTDFYNAKEVNFQKVHAFILFSDKIVIYHYDLTTPSITRTTQITVSAAFSVALEADKSVTIFAKISCECSQKKLVRFNCFSANFNCIATNWFQSSDCSIDIENTPGPA